MIASSMRHCVAFAGWVCVTSSAAAQIAVATSHSPEAESRADEVFARPVTVRLARVPLETALRTIAQSAHVRLQLQADVLEGIGTSVTLHASKLPLGVALECVLVGTSLHAVAISPDFVGIAPIGEISRRGTVGGRVTDAKTGRGLRGVRVSIDGVDRGESSDDGMYRLVVEAGTHTMTVKLIGYSKVTKNLSVQDNVMATVDIALEPAFTALEQVVVTGTVVQTELKAVPNAITVITEKQLEERGITHIDQLFHGDVPGLFAQNWGSGQGAMFEEVTMFSRGATALSSNSVGVDPYIGTTNPIKTYIDGVELADPKYLSQIDPKSIERIEILTGPQASTIYGSNAINGVMQIFTKRGASSAPQLTLNLLSGWVENNFSNVRTPQHDYSAQLNGVEGRMSYNAGGSWNYIGPWTPAKQTTRTSAFGGTRLELVTAVGRVTADVTLRRNLMQNRQRGNRGQPLTSYEETGWYRRVSDVGLDHPTTYTLHAQTLGLTLGYAPTSWWSHEFGIGQDASDTEQRDTARGYAFNVGDTTLYLVQNHINRNSLRYTTTARIPVTSFAQAMVTVGADAWQTLSSSWSVQPQTLTGSLIGTTTASRLPDHNAGGFLQTQLGVRDRLFFTYGLRAEWNPSFGEAAQPNYAPRYGVAYTQEVGVATVKLRGSYGRATRPPQPGAKVAVRAIEWFGPNSDVFSYYGNYVRNIASPELAPEHQQGGEGGVELYVGTRGSFTITRYNQMVDGLIDAPVVDSVRSFDLNPDREDALGIDGYGYQYQYQYLNIGSIRNQGWELQGSLHTGPLTTRGTYSWTKSRTIGVNPKYRAYYADNPQYQPGATFQYLPEHTWAFGMTYGSAATTVGLNVSGTGRVTNSGNDFFFRSLYSQIRLPQNRLNMRTNLSGPYRSFNNGYALMDVTVSHRLLPRIEGVLQVQNLADRYTNDNSGANASVGRQLKIGARLR